MLKRFYKQLWTKFHRKKAQIVKSSCRSFFVVVVTVKNCRFFYFIFVSCRPVGSITDPFKALVFDSNFDHYRGVVTNIAVFGGQVGKGDKIVSVHLNKSYEVNELGLLRPDEQPTQKLYDPQL